MRERQLLPWIEKNFFNQKDPFLCRRWDRLLSHSDIQKEIRSSKKARGMYCYVEATLAHQHVKLINTMLRKAFSNMTLEDIANVAGFTDEKKSTPMQKDYFHTHHVLEYYLRHDVIQHKSRAARLNAYRRWIDVADILFSRHCYEGCLLVIATLNSLDTYLKCQDELPEISQKKLNYLLEMYSPSRNFKVLRTHMKENPSEKALPSISIISKDLTFIDENLNAIKEAMVTSFSTFVNQKKKDRQQLHSPKGREGDILTHRHNQIYKVSKTKKAKTAQVKKEKESELSFLEFLAIPAAQAPAECNAIRESYLAAAQEKTRFIKALMPEKNDWVPLSQQMQLVYEQSEKQYQEKGMGSVINGAGVASTKSNLYSKKLLPGFWNRGGCSAEKHWDKLFSYTT